MHNAYIWQEGSLPILVLKVESPHGVCEAISAYYATHIQGIIKGCEEALPHIKPLFAEKEQKRPIYLSLTYTPHQEGAHLVMEERLSCRAWGSHHTILTTHIFDPVAGTLLPPPRKKTHHRKKRRPSA